MSARDELVDLIEDSIDDAIYNAADAPPSLTGIVADHAADAILAAGYRKPRTITTAEELDALPVDTAIIGTSRIPNKWPGAPYAKASNGEWYDYANEYHVESEDVLLPATVTFEPEATS